LGKKVGGSSLGMIVLAAFIIIACINTCEKRGTSPMFRWSQIDTMTSEEGSG